MNLAPWHNLFLAGAGAGSALAGLIIVAMSVNISTILTIPSMISRAATTVAGLVLVVVVSCAGLVPDQPTAALGAEVVAVSAIAMVLALHSAGEILRQRAAGVGTALAAGKGALGVLPTAASLLGGVLLCANLSAGLYVIAAAIIITFATSVTNTWVLLVEVLR